MYQLLAILSVVCFLLAAPPYIFDTVRSKTKPERATWFIFSVLGIIAFISQAKLGATWSLVFSGTDAFGSVIVFLLSIKFGVGGWAWHDKLALVVASIGTVISLVVQQPIIALLGVILADISGTVLTIRKTFYAPDTETTFSWLVVGCGALTGMFAVGSFDIALLLYPTYLLVANWAVPATQLIGRAHQRSHGTSSGSLKP